MTFEELLERHGRAVSRRTGEHLFRQGDTSRSIFLIRLGLLKAYYVSDDGKENIKSFVQQGNIIGSLKGITGDEGCSFSLVCLEPSELTRIDFDLLVEKSRTDQELANELVRVLLSFAMKKETREYELLCLTAEQRFLKLRNTAPELLERVTQNDIARFLGVTPVGLSRIKKRVAKER